MGKKKERKLEQAQQAALAVKKEKMPLSAGVMALGALLILSSLSHMHKLIVDRELYFRYFNYLPAWLLAARYAFSWCQRIAGILAGAGILARKEIARKLAFAIGVFTLATVYWKHPYEAVKLHTALLDKQFEPILSLVRWTGVSFSSVTPLAVAGLILCDVIFWGIFFYFFTRPSVKAQFKPGV